ncbi:alpha/beta fold hydrolase [Cohnella nanjingensis]|uniref:Alpha/beta hydrolase n=1 Tax=Cohnella nanjingensis TaxID=1387779 RepID=A0A7X0RU97_9BACL|nr:alpha/beta hydrolase [Cohnella nanjingensis]MBB6673802.1 alpha/beta hydrolase [Cohnella nanjingensis]
MKKIISADGTPIAVDVSGSGQPVILVGGAFQIRTDPMMTELANFLAPHFTVMSYDRRGRGDSGDTAPYAVEREIEDIGALMEEAGGNARLFGMSSGAVLALEAACRLPVEKLALYEPPFIVDDSRPPLPPNYLRHLADLLATDRRGDAVEFFMTAAVGIPADMVVQMRHAPFWPAMEAVANTLVYDGTVMGDTMSGHPLPAERWADCTSPTLVVAGEASPAYQRNAVRELGAALRNAKTQSLEGQDHNVSVRLLAPVLLDFFAH